MKNYVFSIIIPTIGRQSLFESIDSVKKAVEQIKPVNCQIIVSDDNASEKTKIKVKNLNSDIEYIVGPKKGPAANRNRGAKFAKGNWLIFTDDDCLPDVNWLSEILLVIEHYGENTIAFEGSILPIGDIECDMSDCPVNNNGGCFWSANIAVSRKIFEEVEGFDENFSIAAFEDTDLYLRLQQRGKIEFLNKAKVFHPVRVERLFTYLKKVPKRMNSWVYLRSKHEAYNNTSVQEITRMLIESSVVLKRNLSWKRKYFFLLTLIRLLINPWMFLYFQKKLKRN